MREPALDLDELMASMKLIGAAGVPLRAAIAEKQELVQELRAYDALRMAATFGGFLTVPELQSNCIRLEALVHVALASGNGQRKPNPKMLARLFSGFGEGLVGWKEDPAEDVFVSSVITRRGNFRILEGVWECAGFYLQRVVNTVEMLPVNAQSERIRECIYALLRLSDVVCQRAQLNRNLLGNPSPAVSLPQKLSEMGTALRRIVTFSESDFAAHGIAVEHLAEFGFDPAARSTLADQTVGHTTLERFPIAHRNGAYFLLLPTAVSAAIRRYVMEQMETTELRDGFVGLLAHEYAGLFSDTQLLGSRSGAPIEFRATPDGLFAGVTTEIDRGLYMNFVFFVDALEGFNETGLLGTNVDSPGFAETLDKWIEHAYQGARQKKGFRAGLSLLVGCGIGRGVVNSILDKPREGWRTEFASGADLLALSWVPKFKPLSLWRILEAQDRVNDLGVHLQNINGLLNLVAWARNLKGHLVPHGDMPDEFGIGDAPSFLVVEQNAVRSLRHEVATNCDPHAVRTVRGSWLKVMRDGQAFFKEDQEQPFFVTLEHPDSRWPLGVYEAKRAWWYRLETTEKTKGAMAYERSTMLRTWLTRIAPVLEEAFPGLPLGALKWCCHFEGDLGESRPHNNTSFLTFDQALASVASLFDPSRSTVTLIASPAFEDAIMHPENIAERALVTRTVEAFAELAGRKLAARDLDSLVARIVPDTSARQTHLFVAQGFRDYVRNSVRRSPITIDSDDEGFIKLGLGWRARDRELGGNIHGMENCTAFLNAVVRLLEDEVCEELKQFDRRSIIEFAQKNHESAAMDRSTWRRTAAAVLSLHDDKEATRQKMAQHDYELNAVFQASRLLVEFALCESPLAEGRKPGRLDFSRLMAKLMMISGMGGWSDAIRWEVMEPHIRVTPLGDIHANVAFSEEVLEPYGRVGHDVRVDEAVQKYAMNLEEPGVSSTDLSSVDAEFWDAWEEQFGASFDVTRKFVEFVENLGLQGRRAAVFAAKRSELLSAQFEGQPLPHEAVSALVAFLTFEPRDQWRKVPDGCEQKDIFPWRFRRQLTMLRRPLIQIEGGADPTYLVAPGILREALVYMLGNYHRGDFPQTQLKPRMRSWAGRSRHRIGHEFNQTVAKQLKVLGWNAKAEVGIRELLGKKFEGYGDIDVLAWNPTTGRVLILECKDVQYRKIYGEIAEQLADFRGVVGTNGKPDQLLRHLNRVELLSTRVPVLKKYLKLETISKLESHLVFKNPVPMQFALEQMKERVDIRVFADLANI